MPAPPARSFSLAWGRDMSKATPIVSAFNAGEWSPLLGGRVDLQGYSASATTIENFICTVQGPIVRRPGTMFVEEVEDSSKHTWLVPFVRSRETSYIIEFGHNICRFYFNRAQVIDGGSPYEISSPYSAGDLFGDDGEFNLDFVQSGDVIYITHRGGEHAPRKLTRTSSTSWAFTTLTTGSGPFDDLNNTSTTLYSDGASGSVTLTASSSIFTADDVGSLIRIDQSQVDTDPWKTATSYTAGDYVRSEGREYQAATTGTSGATIPSHTHGTVSDGGVEWIYRSSGYGVVRITSQSGTTADGDVLVRFPQTLVGSGNASTRWRRGLWSDRNGYPETVSFYNERLCFGMGSRIDMSVVGSFEDFSMDSFGEILPESAISLTIQSAQTNDIMAMVEGEGLLVNTQGGEFTIGPLTTSDPFGPGNIRVQPVSSYGSRPMQALRVGDATLFVQASGRKVREAVFDIQVNNLVSRDLTVRSEHVTESNLTCMVRQEEPYQLVWCVRTDGQIICLTYDRTQEVRGWSRHIVGGSFGNGDAVIESAAVIPSPDGSRDDLWLIVKRTVDGGTVRYIEYVTEGHQSGDDAEDAFYVDCGLTYDGSAVTSISGLDHLEGETVSLLADGATHPQRTVSSGSIDLDRSASVVHIGLPYSATWGSNRIEAGASDGTAQTKTKRITDVSFRVLNSLGGSAGPDLDNMDAIPALNYRLAETPMDRGAGLYTGDALVDWPGGYETDGRIYYQNNDPLPVTIIAAVPQVSTQEAR